MKILMLAGCIVAATAFSGCASAPMQTADIDGAQVCDTDKMDQVERTAHKHPTTVQWVNCPKATLRVVKS